MKKTIEIGLREHKILLEVQKLVEVKLKLTYQIITELFLMILVKDQRDVHHREQTLKSIKLLFSDEDGEKILTIFIDNIFKEQIAGGFNLLHIDNDENSIISIIGKCLELDEIKTLEFIFNYVMAGCIIISDRNLSINPMVEKKLKELESTKGIVKAREILNEKLNIIL